MHVAEKDYALHDPENEEKFGFKLADALRRAKANGGKVFAGMTFYITPKVPIDAKLLKNVVMAGGGQVCISVDPFLSASVHSVHVASYTDTYGADPQRERRPICHIVSLRCVHLEAAGRSRLPNL